MTTTTAEKILIKSGQHVGNDFLWECVSVELQKQGSTKILVEKWLGSPLTARRDGVAEEVKATKKGMKNGVKAKQTKAMKKGMKAKQAKQTTAMKKGMKAKTKKAT